MPTYSASEFKKKYGDEAYQSLGTETQTQKSYGDKVGEAFKGGLDYFEEGRKQAESAKTPFGALEAGLKEGAGLVGAAFSPIAPIFEPISKGINYAADKISDNPEVQKFAMSDAGKATARGAENIQNTTALLGLRGAPKAASVVKAAPGAAMDAASGVAKTLTKPVEGIMRDITPTAQAVIDHKIAQAFELTRGDLTNIQSSTGNNVGRWLADNNLIGKNTKETVANIQALTDTNYQSVRQEINSVPTIYRPNEVPRYMGTLEEIKSQLVGQDGKALMGLESDVAKIEKLLNKEEVLLSDVQAVKEMLDKHYDLYKVTGDAKAGIDKGRLSTIRGEIKNFIENEVEKSGGGDIRAMNKNVQTGKTLLRSIEKRDAPGLKPWQAMGDLGTFGLGMYLTGGPIGGAALFFLRKAWNTPGMQLRVAKTVDKWNDAKKAKAAAKLQAGQIPEEFDEFIEYTP